MPIPVFQLDEQQDSADLRANFVGYVKCFLGYIVHNYREEYVGNLPIYDNIQQRMEAAWHEALELKEIQELEEEVKNLCGNIVARHGLSGAQLMFKLANVAWWSQKVEEATTRGMRIAFQDRLFISIDSLLETILAATGSGSALKEMKEAIWGSLEG